MSIRLFDMTHLFQLYGDSHCAYDEVNLSLYCYWSTFTFTCTTWWSCTYMGESHHETLTINPSINSSLTHALTAHDMITN